MEIKKGVSAQVVWSGPTSKTGFKIISIRFSSITSVQGASPVTVSVNIKNVLIKSAGPGV